MAMICADRWRISRTARVKALAPFEPSQAAQQNLIAPELAL
jgi:hypothetical protein